MPESFHEAFAAALAGDAGALKSWSAGPKAETGLAVYRNTIAKGRAEALVAQFPTVLRVVGERWLTAAALAHAAAHPPRRPSLAAYGEDFPAWLETFAPAVDIPFLPDLARIDWDWTEASLAADRAPLGADAITVLAPDAYASMRLDLHPATRAQWFDNGVPSLWLALQPPGPPPAEILLDDAAEGLAFVRPDQAVTPLALGAGAFAFLAACRDGESLAQSALAALTAQPDLDLSRTFAELLGAGAFTSLRSFT